MKRKARKNRKQIWILAFLIAVVGLYTYIYIIPKGFPIFLWKPYHADTELSKSEKSVNYGSRTQRRKFTQLTKQVM